MLLQLWGFDGTVARDGPLVSGKAHTVASVQQLKQ